MFGNHLKRIRTIRNRTQQEVADFLNISTQSVSKWENNLALPSIEYLPKLAKFFSCTMNAFFYESELKYFENFKSRNKEEQEKYILAIINSKDKQVSKESVLSGLYECLKEKEEINISDLQHYINLGYSKTAEIIELLEKINLIEKNTNGFGWIINKNNLAHLSPFIDQIPEYFNIQ